MKRDVITELDGILGDDAIIATNTSSLSVTEISTATARPGRVVGVHFFNPRRSRSSSRWSAPS